MEKQAGIEFYTKNAHTSRLQMLLMWTGILLIGYYCVVNDAGKMMRTQPEPPPAAVRTAAVSAAPAAPKPLPVSVSVQEPEPMYPTDKLFITEGRQAYADGEMTLRVPRLGLDAPVLDGMDTKTLDRGVGLYEYAQLPGKGNRNTSMTAHRDIFKAEFYYIDTIAAGDLIYLDYDGVTYTYQYESTQVVEANDWSPIYCNEYPCVTLVSCTPIGTSLRRLVVTARLIGQEETISG